MIEQGAPWVLFLAFVLALLALDLFVLHRNAHEIPFKSAAKWMVIWILMAVAFTPVMWLMRGDQAAGEYLAAYILELTISIDTVFVFATVFSYFAVPPELRHRVLFWGVLGALVFRLLFIVAGIAVIERFHWSIYIFGAFLVYTGFKMLRSHGGAVQPENNPILRLVRRVIPVTPEYHGPRFFVRNAGKLMATPLFAVLVVIESTDIMFAIDSIPVAFSITRDPFVVYTSNVFALLGLRTLYFLLAGLVDRIAFVRAALSALLVLAGVKMLLSDIFHVPVWVVLLVIAAVGGVVYYQMRLTLPELRGLVMGHKAIGPDQRLLFSNVFEVGERRLRDLMIPRQQIFTIEGATPVAEAARLLAASGHTRAPVEAGGLDRISGVIYLVDLLRAREGTAAEHARPALVLPESIPALSALKSMQEARQQLVLVVDEHGGTEGLVTLEDILEEVVGELWDPYDAQPKQVRADRATGAITLPGSFPVHELAEHGVTIPSGAWVTVAGLVMSQLGRIPVAGESVVWGDWQFEVLSVDGHRLRDVRLTPVEVPAPAH